MIFTELGQHIDIHTGGTDHIPVHHTNEIAQSECASGKKFVNYWLHGEFLVLDKNQRMGKSEGNFITLQNLIDEKFNPVAYRYLTLTSHYRSFLTFSNEILKSAQTAYLNLKKLIKNQVESTDESNKEKADHFDQQIEDAFLDDLNVPKALGLVWELLHSNEIGSKNKIDIVKKYDAIFSLNLFDFSDLDEKIEVPSEIVELAEQRFLAKQNKDFAESDRLRKLIQEQGFDIRDSKDEYEVVKK